MSDIIVRKASRTTPTDAPSRGRSRRAPPVWLRFGIGLLPLLTAAHLPTAAAQLVADPGASGDRLPFKLQASTDNAISLGARDDEGFAMLSFLPNPNGQEPAWLTIGPTQGNWDWKALHSLQMHIQNAMPWPVTLLVQLRDADGGTLTGTIGLPPGPPVRLGMPLTPTQPLAMGMRAGPPAPWTLDEQNIALIETTEGALNRSRITEIRIGMPPPDAEQKIRLGKIFLPEDGGHEVQTAYTAIVDAWGQYTRLDWPAKYHESNPSPAEEKTAKQKARAERRKKGKDRKPDPSEAFKPFASFVNQNEQRLNEAVAAQRKTVANGQELPALDGYGGIQGIEQTAQGTGYFRTGKLSLKDGSQRHILITPEGNPFFSLGVNAVQRKNSETFTEGREFQFGWLPAEDSPLARFKGNRDSTETLPAESGAQRNRRFLKGDTFDFYQANLYRRDGDAWLERWSIRAQRRLKSWGFNTIGAWSDHAALTNPRLPHTRIVHIEGPFARLSDGHDWWAGIPDPFDPAFGKALDTSLRKATANTQENPQIIGWFVDNELGWGDGAATDPAQRYALALSVLRTDGSQPEAHAKRTLVQMLRDRYDGDINELARTWGIPLGSWSDVESAWPADRSPDASQPAVAADLSAFLRLHAESYFSQVAKALERHAPNHLYLGSRFASRTPEAVAACVRWCDVVSFNLYIPNLNEGFEAEEFARHDKPALLTEFHFGSSDRGPFWPGVMSVATEAERGPAYRRMIESVLNNRQFVGAHWFQYLDQPVTGRWLDGENGHLGLIAVTDIPWHDFVLSVHRTHLDVQQKLHNDGKRLDAPAATEGPGAQSMSSP
ncbi:MAG: beta-galactosidase [Lautropia sp.]|nr:beta-galactosidase [Lautropia sp.]